jgi:hypothetical protein
MAEAHPVGFRWVMKAKERGARVIHVDPRYSRTSQLADQHVPIRAGTDIAFLGGLIRHVLETESYFRDYVVHYTNAATIIDERFKDVEDLDGVFSGLDPETGMYDSTTWMYEGGEVPAAAGAREHSTQAFATKTGAGMLVGDVKRDDPCSTRAASSRCCAATSAATPRRWSSRSVGYRRPTSTPRRRRSSRTPAASARAPSATRLAGRSTASAFRSLGRRRSCSCCSGTSGDPEAGSSRCAGTRRCRQGVEAPRLEGSTPSPLRLTVDITGPFALG